jgi:hypothetical protein
VLAIKAPFDGQLHRTNRTRDPDQCAAGSRANTSPNAQVSDQRMAADSGARSIHHIGKRP